MKYIIAAIGVAIAKADWNGIVKQMAAMSDDIENVGNSEVHGNIITGVAAGVGENATMLGAMMPSTIKGSSGLISSNLSGTGTFTGGSTTTGHATTTIPARTVETFTTTETCTEGIL